MVKKGRFADWEEKPVKDYDPEAEPKDPQSDSEDSAEEDEGAAEATSHYVSVGKSKLRRKEPVALGPQYRGARVSRDALDQDDEDEDEEDGEDDQDDDDDDDDGEETRGPDGSSDYEDAREGFDDPDKADLARDQQEHEDEDAEIDSDNALCESDEEKLQGFTFRGSSQTIPMRGKKVTRPTAADFMDDEAEESEEDEGVPGDDDEEDEDEDDEDEDASDLDGFIDDEEDEDEDEDEELDDDEEDVEGDDSGDGSSDDGEDEDESSRKSSKKGGRGDLKSMMTAGTQSVASAVASSIQKDVEKGKAVRQQRKAFDAALNVRIRLQKALVAVNSFPGAEDEDMSSEPYEAAEAAAVKLLNAIDDFRAGMQPKAGQKRKRELDASSSSQDIWNSMQELERPAIARRKAVLDNWSKKVKATQMINSGTGKGSKLVKVDEPLTMMLENHMQDPERLIKRTRTPRSCAPIQVAQKVNEDPNIYDDADFYQLLLKELVDQRTTDTSVGGGGQAATVRYAAAKEAKTKKHVDTKASKGRKMRFNVHEKLQNFMAPEDRRAWEQHAIDRFFGTLFGQKMMLNEDDVSDEEMDGVTAEEEGLRLFRS